MSVFHTTCRLLNGHSRLALLSSQSLVLGAGQGTCYHWTSKHETTDSNLTSGSTVDWKHLLREHQRPKPEFMNFTLRHFHASKSTCINKSWLSQEGKKSRYDISLTEIQPLSILNSVSPNSNRCIHSVTQHHRVLKPHPLLNTHHRLDQGGRPFSITTKFILESSPPSIQPYLRLIRFDKPIGTYLLFWPCTWSIALAADPGHLPDLYLLAMFGAGAFIMRGAGCIVNDMWDSDYDKKVARTRTRPLASGELSHFQALVFLGSQLSLALGILLQFNTYSILLGAASMGLVVTYPLAKRYTYWPQLMLGVTLNWGVLLAWSALRGTLDPSVMPLYLACVVYTIFYDTIYSHQDKYDDMLIGVKSTALKLGDQTKPWLTGFSAVMVSGLTLSGYMCDQTWPFYLGVMATASHLVHQMYTVDLNNPDDCATKFRSNTQIGIIMFLAIMFGSLLKGTKVTEDKKMDSISDTKK